MRAHCTASLFNESGGLESLPTRAEKGAGGRFYAHCFSVRRYLVPRRMHTNIDGTSDQPGQVSSSPLSDAEALFPPAPLP